MNRNKFHLRWMLAGLIGFLLIGSACQLFSPEISEPETALGTPTSVPADAMTSPVEPGEEAISTQPAATLPAPQEGAEPVLAFSSFEEPTVDAVPSLPKTEVAADWQNVYNPFVLSSIQLERLRRDGFVVSPGSDKEFFTVYEKARYSNVPIFVTSDSLLHSYHLLFDKVLRTAEVEHFIPLLQELNRSILQTADEQYQALKDTAWGENARRTVAFIAVASRLLEPEISVPEYARDLVEQELSLIEAAAGIQPSPLFPHLEFGEDYTQYIPRGHYTRSEELKAYFKSMMWYGRMTFRLKTLDPEAGRDETRSAILLVNALGTSQVNGRPAIEAWADLYSPTVFFVGRSDDLTVLQYMQVMDAVYGPEAPASALVDEERLDQFIAEADKLPPPKILGIVIQATDDETQVTKGLRFMGQRFVPDAYIFRQLIYRNVGTGENRRGLPKGLDLFAAMGSERAYAILDEMGDTSYENYPQQMEKVQSWLAGLTVSDWTETLYNSWLYSFYPLLDEPGEGYPAFMQSPAWLDKQLNTVLGSWAELKHDTILYAKQVYAEMGGGPPPPGPVPPRGYVEPVPHFYARLAALTAMTREGLESRGLLTELDKASLTRLEELARAFQTMSEKELRGEPLTEAEFDMILYYGGELEHLVMASADSDSEDPFAENYMDEEPQVAVIADVATDPDPNGDGLPDPVVLEEAVGRVNEIHVIVPLIQEDGSIFLQVAKGGVFSYYEFTWPADDRLTDEKWRAMLEAGQAPDLPGWTNSFYVSEGEYYELQQAVQNYQGDLTSVFWYIDMGLPEGFEALAQFKPELDALLAAEQHMGRQLIQSRFTSFDLQSETLGVLTTEETWEDKLYSGVYAEYDAEPIAQRGPYTLNVTYTVERTDGTDWPGWKVTQAVYSGPPPEWEMNE